MKTINDFTVFHIFILISFYEYINAINKIIINFNLLELITTITIISLEILVSFVFVEIIELNFCGLNRNLKRNIINRGDNEINKLYEEKDGESEEDNNNSEISSELINSSESNSIY